MINIVNEECKRLGRQTQVLKYVRECLATQNIYRPPTKSEVCTMCSRGEGDVGISGPMSLRGVSLVSCPFQGVRISGPRSRV